MPTRSATLSALHGGIHAPVGRRRTFPARRSCRPARHKTDECVRCCFVAQQRPASPRSSGAADGWLAGLYHQRPRSGRSTGETLLGSARVASCSMEEPPASLRCRVWDDLQDLIAQLPLSRVFSTGCCPLFAATVPAFPFPSTPPFDQTSLLQIVGGSRSECRRPPSAPAEESDVRVTSRPSVTAACGPDGAARLHAHSATPPPSDPSPPLPLPSLLDFAASPLFVSSDVFVD